MKGYLTQLAARTLEQPQPIRPRLASLFEPVSGTRLRLAEVPAQRPNRLPRSAGPRVNGPDRNAPQESHRTRRAPDERAGTESTAHRIEDKIEAGDFRSADPVGKPADPREYSSAVAGETIVDPLIERPAITSETSLRTEPQAPEFVWERPIPAVQVTPSLVRTESIFTETFIESPAENPHDSTSREEPTSAPRIPTVTVKRSVNVGNTLSVELASPALDAPEPEALAPIRITIGRVDVRAIMAPPPPPPPAVRPTKDNGALSLDKYLQQRKGT